MRQYPTVATSITWWMAIYTIHMAPTATITASFRLLLARLREAPATSFESDPDWTSTPLADHRLAVAGKVPEVFGAFHDTNCSADHISADHRSKFFRAFTRVQVRR